MKTRSPSPACAFDNDLMATVWMHNGFLQVEGRKMSKSEGNFVTIQRVARDGDIRWTDLAGSKCCGLPC